MQDCEVVLHLAVLIGIRYFFYSPDTYVDTNIQGTLNVLQAGSGLRVEQTIDTVALAG
jgi:nucleoside-diphosphate-sugar epimerase